MVALDVDISMYVDITLGHTMDIYWYVYGIYDYINVF